MTKLIVAFRTFAEVIYSSLCESRMASLYSNARNVKDFSNNVSCLC